LAKTHNWKDVLGYLVMDQDEKPIGPIQDILSHGAIFLAEVSFEQKIVTIPLNENLVLNKNEEQKILKMEIPTGLLDL
jgi:ribosomal 30S subunit maturation factor RimM